MSYTAIYTPLHGLRTEPSDFIKQPGAVTPGAKILDPEGLREFVPDWDTDMHTHTTTVGEQYPRKKWEFLEGFKTWDFDQFNIERLAIPSDDAVDFWASVSEYTDPFQFFTSYHAGSYPHALDIVTADEQPVAYHVICLNGSVWVNEIGARRTEREQVYRGEA